jgi:putative hydrolase of HD superfamily
LAAATRLKRLPRTGWVLAGVVEPESVADHTTATTLLALALGAWINAAPERHGLSAPLDLGKLAQMVLAHDLAESRVTDLPHDAVALIGQAVKRRAEEQVLAELVESFPQPPNWAALWREYNDGATPEARLAHDADKLEMVHQALAYEMTGHRNLDEFWEGRRWHYAISGEVFAIMAAARPAR